MIFSLVKNELVKVFANKKIYAFLSILFLIGLVPVVGSLMVKVSTFTGQTYPLFLHGLTVSWVIPLFIAVLISDMFTEEYVKGTLTLSLIHPVTRGEMIAAKAISVLILILFLLVFTMASGYVIGSVIFGWGPQFMLSGIKYSAHTGIQLTIYSFLSSALPLFVFGTMVMFLALLFYNSGVVVGISIGLMLLFAFLGYVAAEIGPYLITGYFTAFPNALLFTGDHWEIIMALKVMVLYGIFFYAASIAVFKKKDLLN